MPDRDREANQGDHGAVLIPSVLLLAGEAFPGIGSATEVLGAIDRGLSAGGLPPSDLCPLDPAQGAGRADGALLTGVGFDARLHLARAIVIAADELDPGRLPGSMSFELATRARQGGVPAFAVTAHNGLDPFDARVLDLQAVIEADTLRGLAAAGRGLARLL